MVKAETSALGEYSAPDPGRDGAVDGAIRTGERGAL